MQEKIMEVFKMSCGMSDREKIIGKITEMICRIADENLLNRIYKFVKYIYLHRDGRAAV